MECTVQTTTSIHQIETSAIAVGIYEDNILSPMAKILNRISKNYIYRIVESEFSAEIGKILVLRNIQDIMAERIVLVGLGKRKEYSSHKYASAERSFAQFCIDSGLLEGTSTILSNKITNDSILTRACIGVISIGQVTYVYNETFGKNYNSNINSKSSLSITQIVEDSDIIEARNGIRNGNAIVNGMKLARKLGDLPGNICTPTYLGQIAHKLSDEFKSIKVQVLDAKEIREIGMNSFLSVANGSDEPPKLIVLHYSNTSPKNSKPIVLIGKGITFDSGGISLKPSANMDEMKYDMCGAASVLGTFRSLAELELKQNIIGIIPTCENLLNGKSNKPGDVITSMSGQTIEILNTDAEGRLLLCDALTYAKDFNPEIVIDIATLTGACVVALGDINSGLFSTDDELTELLIQTGKKILDPVWRLPLEMAYKKQLKSRFADIANISKSPEGAITAACFLSHFANSYRWAHLDIAGTAWKRGEQKGATGRPIPLLVQFLLSQSS